ncbi:MULTISPECIES: cyclopropane-fatty-acyl-phospholipid synthase family protein [unclassified Polaromonas]|jgi:cyclopropane-fatty-acyl-phospholipid synthase|uniref:SAM-dependent methyltransferase n=1 Tax=unclassified Polaromonas TaxID=2638319 RepID=UPI0018CA7B05|nr:MULTISPECIES: cyclopropane-fatty-acyl-phospholipid synthase family protein [unclassified Polaromonas]MBG6073466.1 cyclopropane-fatty-acyl-phospholipid synthase [Polaromonas sp. CG_9.7]MBG6115488.1 cyclopropane-fatty-acyl-phospholipid synthase [Polaromonas sp. CG_9.2]MDH6183298.1 cyclopropane-fatty-acyl-phospholipid synthase [Polaromonas sp. CG_23.6]
MTTLNPTSAPAIQPIPRDAPGAARTALKMLRRLKHGTLTVQLPDGALQRFGSGTAPMASLHLHNWKPCSAALRSGDIGFAESYIAGDWTTPHLTDLMELLIINRKEVESAIYGSWLGRLAYRVKHLLNRNTKANSQKNIHAHYDLGNAFYALWLDKTMNYSSAIFESPETTMVEGQMAKVRRALSLTQVKPGDRVLEIGCGWGALAEMATTEFSASVVGVTLSTEQLEWAKQRMARLGASDKADLRLQDYRDIGKTTPDAPFDAICSIEMVEAVGREYWPEYFRTVARLLKPGGHACIQSIVIDDALFERYIGSTDFIQQYIFPGGCLPCPREFRAQAEAAGFDIVDEFSFGQDYARTLRLWRDDFLAQEQRVLRLGFDKKFIRIWEFYLAYCEAAFAQGNTSVMQFTLRKR